MLTRKQNLIETIRGGKPDRFVNQYEYIKLLFDPITLHYSGCPKGGSNVTDWGVRLIWPEHEPGAFPVHNAKDTLLQDITKWRDVIEANAPDPHKIPESEWEAILKSVEKIDRNEYFISPFSSNGLFEKMHFFMGMEDALVSMYEEPEAAFDLIDFIADWTIETAKEIVQHYHPDAIFQHDDWGSQTTLLMSPDMWREFFKPAYKKLYGFWRNEGKVELIIHHSDSFIVPLVPDMIDLGVDIHQGTVSENNIPELIKKYGGKISFHGGIDNGKYDKADWSREEITAGLEKLIRETGGKYLIPGFIRGLPGSNFDGPYDWVTEEIDRLSKEYFK